MARTYITGPGLGKSRLGDHAYELLLRHFNNGALVNCSAATRAPLFDLCPIT